MYYIPSTKDIGDGSMIKLIQFEMKKIVKSNFFRIILLGFCIFIVAYYVFIYLNTMRVEDLIVEAESTVQRNNENLERLSDSLDASDEQGKKQIESELEFWEEWSKEDEIKLKALQENDWTTLLKQAIAKDEDHSGQIYKR